VRRKGRRSCQATRHRSRQCEQTPAISITGLFGAKPAARHEAAFERFRDSAARRLADRAATFADQKDDRIAAGVIVHTGDERVAALDAMDETVVAQEIERAIDRDRRRTAGSDSRSMIS
jgi:hypothetical protein